MVISEPKRRIGVMGGSFNPVHCGHLRVARDVKQRLELDHMFLMPAGQSPLKAQHSVSARHRVAMLELAIEAFPELELDLREVNRAGRSFTVDSLSALRREFGSEARLYLLLATIAWHRFISGGDGKTLFFLQTLLLRNDQGHFLLLNMRWKLG